MSALLRTCEGLVRAIDLLAETYPHPDGRPVRLGLSVADSFAVHAHADIETVAFLACRAAESAARGRVTVDVDRLAAAQAKADAVIRGIAEAPEPGRHLRVAVTVPETGQRLATGFVNYQTAGRHLRLVAS